MIPLPPGRLRDALAPLRGQVLRLEIAGLGFGPQLTLDAIGLRPAFGRADVTVRATLAAYVKIGYERRADPGGRYTPAWLQTPPQSAPPAWWPSWLKEAPK